ncbi:MAG: hypothetical protein WEB30_19705 [Cyclobacteriaceae bacterium]
MQNDNVNIRRKSRRNDFPERQVGFPERNDVSNPNTEIEMERIHVDFKTLGISKKSAAEIIREIRETNVPET